MNTRIGSGVNISTACGRAGPGDPGRTGAGHNAVPLHGAVRDRARGARASSSVASSAQSARTPVRVMLDLGASATSLAVTDPAISTFLNRSGLVRPGEAVRLLPLTGGVASDIFRVEVGDRSFVVKKALARLRVAQEWNAPVSRNASEVGWFIEAKRAVPQAVPDILAHEPALGLFAMTYLDPASHPIWKEELRDGRASSAFASAVGQTVAAVHAATAHSADVARHFANDETFHAIRLDPTSRRPQSDTMTSRRNSARFPERRSGASSSWCTATSVRRTSSLARPDLCCSMPNAPGTASRPSTWPSASTTCSSSASGSASTRPNTSPASMPFGLLPLRRALGSARERGGARGKASAKHCCSAASMGSRPSSTSRRTSIGSASDGQLAT